jgi:outer membrane protein assembly factor BamB
MIKLECFIRLATAAVLCCSSASAMNRIWTRMTGQTPVETAPLVGDFNHDSRMELLAVNRGGQVMLWSLDGKDAAAGQDGTVTQLPEGRWTSAPALMRGGGATGLLFVSNEGLVVALGQGFEEQWRYKLPGETAWAMATPTAIDMPAGELYCVGDRTGAVTCLNASGRPAWQAKAAGSATPANTRPPMLAGAGGLLVAAGPRLYAYDGSGHVLWQGEVGGNIVTRPLRFAGATVVGSDSGAITAVADGGRILWTANIGETPDSVMAAFEGAVSGSLLLCRGAWGDLHAIDAQGRRVWTHYFRSKSRNAMAIGGRIYVPTFSQHVYVFDAGGDMVDDYRLAGAITATPVPIGPADFVVVTASLLAYRMRGGAAVSQYGASLTSSNVRLAPHRVENPEGALIRATTTVSRGAFRGLRTLMTSRTLFQLEAPAGDGDRRTTIRDANGAVIAESSWPAKPAEGTPRNGGLRLSVQPARPYAAFDPDRTAESDSHAGVAVRIQGLYLNEAGHGAFVVRTAHNEAVRVRVAVEMPKRKDGTPFAGAVSLREVVLTGSVNGERVPDALVPLGEAGLILIPSARAVKIWVTADSRGAEPGVYEGALTITPLRRETEPAKLPFELEVLALKLPPSRLRLCTWDYVPNRWFPAGSSATEALDDMGRHGVNVFPRSTVMPKGKVDAGGRMEIDWTALDAELDRYRGRGQILFQFGDPPLEFAVKPDAEGKRKLDISYLRSFRDHLASRGWSYDAYAFYPLDEPGLDYGKNIQYLVGPAPLYREADPKFRIYTDPVPGLAWRDFERIEPFVDVWCPNMRLVTGLLSGDPRMERIMKGREIWSYECVSQVKSLSPLRYNRSNAWRARFFGLNGIGFWTHSTTDVDHWLPGKGINDEFALVYPGERPVASARWEAVRDGLQDIAAIDLLRQQVESNRRAGARLDVVARAEKEIRLALADIMQLSDAAFIESRDFLPAGSRVLPHTDADEETFSRHRAAMAALTMALEEK